MRKARQVFRQVYDLIDEMKKMSDPESVASLFEAFSRSLKADYFIISGIPRKNEQISSAVVAHNWPEEIIKIYCENRYNETSVVVQHIPKTNYTFDWRDVQYYPDSEEDEYRKLRDWLVDIGMGYGLSTPVHHGGGRHSNISLSSSSPLDLTDEEKMALDMVAHFTHNCLRFLTGSGIRPGRGLTRRETEVLNWVAAGKTAWEISEILTIAERTVISHVENAKMKLNASNRSQCVAEAIRQGLILV